MSVPILASSFLTMVVPFNPKKVSIAISRMISEVSSIDLLVVACPTYSRNCVMTLRIRYGSSAVVEVWLSKRHWDRSRIWV